MLLLSTFYQRLIKKIIDYLFHTEEIDLYLFRHWFDMLLLFLWRSAHQEYHRSRSWKLRARRLFIFVNVHNYAILPTTVASFKTFCFLKFLNDSSLRFDIMVSIHTAFNCHLTSTDLFQCF